MVYITRKERFSAAHRLFNPEWTDEKNYQVYGKCANANWHGHNYDLLVTIKGEINPKLGYLVDLKDLSNILKVYIIDKVDHRNLNTEVDFMKGKILSTENLAISIWEQIEPEIKKLNVQLHSVKVQETENNYAEYYGK